MTTDGQPLRRPRPVRWVGDFSAGISAVGGKEFRGRMRGRRAFAILTVYLLLLSVFAFGIYQYLRDQADATAVILPGGPMVDPGFAPQVSSSGLALGATIGHAVFSGLLIVETILILVLAPALTAGAISLEREKQTLDLLVATPLSTVGMVLGKLVAALSYVFLLIVASIPLASVVFAFGGVGPEDLVRGYALLFAVAFGMGAIGLFISALVRRTQTATVVTFAVVLALTAGTAALHEFLVVTTRPSTTDGFVAVQTRHRAPEALLWLNPLVADLDLVCTTTPSGSHPTCSYLSTVTGRPYFGSSVTQPCTTGVPCPELPVFIEDRPAVDRAEAGDDVDGGRAAIEPGDPVATLDLGFPRDTFWPRSALAFVVVGAILVLLSTQLIAPSRRLRLPRPRRGPSIIESRSSAEPATTHVTEVPS